jgi:DNA-binding PadR family transcriptional regulator
MNMGPRPHRRPWLAALAASLLLGQPAWAQDPRAFPILKRLEQQKLSEALEMVRASQRCVEAARNLRALHECHRQEREREWEQRERFRSQIEAVRSRYGLRRPREEPPGPGSFGRPPPGPF